MSEKARCNSGSRARFRAIAAPLIVMLSRREASPREAHNSFSYERIVHHRASSRCARAASPGDVSLRLNMTGGGDARLRKVIDACCNPVEFDGIGMQARRSISLLQGCK